MIMETPDLLMVCVSAFSAVFVLLALLAVVMRILIAAFPELVAKADPAMLAAVSATVAAVFPGAKITRVEEER
jgi:hypothetical protein